MGTGSKKVTVDTAACAACSLTIGRWIDENFESHSVSTGPFENVCPAEHQCVGAANATEGCCQRCAPSQLCTPATVVFGFDHGHDWNQCPPGMRCDDHALDEKKVISKCPAGFMCEKNKMMSCDAARKIPIDAGYGDVHAGSYCPEGSSGLVYCPTGKYCNLTNMTAARPCPSGFFCPLKTEAPKMRCYWCAEGAKQKSKSPVLLFLVVFALCLALAAVALKHRLRKNRQQNNDGEKEKEHGRAERNEQLNDGEKLDRGSPLVMSACENEEDLLEHGEPLEIKTTPLSKTLSGRFLTTVRGHEKEKEQLEPGEEHDVETPAVSLTLPPLTKSAVRRSITNKIATVIEESESIAEETEENSAEISGGLSRRKLRKKISRADISNPALLFDYLDLSMNNYLTEEELRTTLKYSDAQAKYFARKINQLAGAPLFSKTMSREAFIDHALECFVMTDLLDVKASGSGIATLFDNLDLDGNGFVEGAELHCEALDKILTGSQIQAVLKKFMLKQGVHKMDEVVISRDEFVGLFAKFTNDVVREEVERTGIDIAFERLRLTVSVSGKTVDVVDGITGRLMASSMSALMGGSGAGKTSLLNALCGRAYYGEMTGSIMINGNMASVRNLKNLVGFVPQDDIVYAELTVRENFIFAGRFRLPPSWTEEEIENLADDVIASLGLVRVRNSIVGNANLRGVSGGEKKRVNIGLELMSTPRILFLDEPTSGLDSASSALVMHSLKRLVQEKGVTIATVIHQPRQVIFNLFDNVILLAAGGKTVFIGPPKSITPYFMSVGYSLPGGIHVADWMLDISTGNLRPGSDLGNDTASMLSKNSESTSSPLKRTLSTLLVQEARKHLFEQWEDSFEKMPATEKAKYLPPSPSHMPVIDERPSFFKQVSYHIHRNMLVSYRNARSRILDTVVAIVAVVFVAAFDGPLTFGPSSVELADDRLLVPLSYISEDVDNLPFDEMFKPFQAAADKDIGNAMKVSVICAVLVCLNATKYMSDKCQEQFREASSDYSINAYFTAINITSSIDLLVQMVITGLFAYSIRDPPSLWISFIFNFIMLAWICASWGFLFSVIIPTKNLVTVSGFFIAFCSLLFGGGIPPLQFQDIYASPGKAILSGLFAPTRYFIETYVVSDFKCLPVQMGYTHTNGNENHLPEEYRSFNVKHLGQSNKTIAHYSCRGWTWGYLPAFFVGLTIRLLAGLLMHFVSRSKQNKPSLAKSMQDIKFILSFVPFILATLLCLALSIVFILVER